MNKKRADHLSLSDKVIYATAWGPVVCKVRSLSWHSAYGEKIMIGLESVEQPQASFTFFVAPGDELEMSE